MHTSSDKKTLSRSAGVSLLAAVMALILAACTQTGAAPAVEPQPPKVPVANPVRDDVPIRIELPGHVEAIERVEIAPQVGGAIDRLAFVEGARVAKGDLLVQIDPAPYEAAVARARATLMEAEAQTQVAEAEANRAQRLLGRQAISAEETARREAEAAVARARRESARAELRRARIDLDHTRVLAPIDGRIGRAERTAGNIVAPGEQLALLVSDAEVYVRFDLAESDLTETPGMNWRARFTLPEQPGRSHEGRLAFVENEVNAETGTLRSRIVLAGDPALLPGRYGQVELTVGERKDALLIEETAIGADQGHRYVLVVDASGTVQYRPVHLGPKVGTHRVVLAGLAPEDRIVIAGLTGVRPGMTVAPEETPSTTATAVATTSIGKEG